MVLLCRFSLPAAHRPTPKTHDPYIEENFTTWPAMTTQKTEEDSTPKLLSSATKTNPSIKIALRTDYWSETRQLQTFAAHPEQLVTFWLMRLTQGEVQLLKSGPWGSQYPSGPTHMYEATPKETRERTGWAAVTWVSLCVSLWLIAQESIKLSHIFLFAVIQFPLWRAINCIVWSLVS